MSTSLISVREEECSGQRRPRPLQEASSGEEEGEEEGTITQGCCSSASPLPVNGDHHDADIIVNDHDQPTNSTLRNEYNRLEKAYRRRTARDREDVNEGLRRERRFTVAYTRMSRNQLWSPTEGPACEYYDGTPEEYMQDRDVWPRGRHLHELNVYQQLYDFFRFMWSHTKPYKTVAAILVMSIIKPFQVAAISWVAQNIQEHPRTTPLWAYFFPLYGNALEGYVYWWYEMWVPLNSQRVQLRCVLLKKRSRLPRDHPMAVKWQAGRFTGLLKDVDDVINGVWHSMLAMFDNIVTMIYLLALCFFNLAVSANNDEEYSYNELGVYVGVFLALWVVVMAMPFVWFWMFDGPMQECETMVRDGQALYMSASNARLVAAGEGGETLLHSKSGGTFVDSSDDIDDSGRAGRERRANETAVQSYWLYGRTTFRAFFHRLAWKTNYILVMNIGAPFAAYFLLTEEGFGLVFSPANILVILLSLKDLNRLSGKLLEYLAKMSRGCNVLRDVAELLNSKADEYCPVDLEKGMAVVDASAMECAGHDGGFVCTGEGPPRITKQPSRANSQLRSVIEDATNQP